jgi:hypothetical protein
MVKIKNSGDSRCWQGCGEIGTLLHCWWDCKLLNHSGTLYGGSSGSTMSSFLRNSQTGFQSGCVRLQSHQQWRSVPLSPHHWQHLLSPEFLILAFLTDVKWNLRVVLIWNSLMTKDAEHCFRCFMNIWVSSVENSLLSSVPFFIMVTLFSVV